MSTSGKSHTLYNETVNPLIPKKYTIKNGNFMFNLCDVLQECNLTLKQDLPTEISPPLPPPPPAAATIATAANNLQNTQKKM